MTVRILSVLIIIFTVCGCSASSSTVGDDGVDFSGAGDAQPFRLIRKQTSFMDGSSHVVSYEYDQVGNLIGLVSGNTILTYSIDTDGRIINVVGSVDGIPLQATLIYIYDVTGGLKRIDNLGSIEGVGVIGVSAFDLYKFEDGLATSLETRIIPFEEIVLDTPVADSAGFIRAKTVFEYNDGRLVRELVDDVVDIQRDYMYNSDGTLSSALDTGASTNSHVYSYEQGECNLNWGNSTHRYFCVSGNELAEIELQQR